MPTYPSVTYTFVNGNASDASQVNQNFTDIINGLSDGTKDIQVNDIAANGNVVLGGSTADTVTFNALLGNATFNQASGDPQVNFKIGGTQKFSMGVDDSDSDKFKLSSTADIATTPAFVINSNAEVEQIRGVTDGSTPVTGCVGEVLTNSVNDTGNVVQGAWTVDGQITLSAGSWILSAHAVFSQTGAGGQLTTGILNIDTAGGTSTPSVRNKGINETNIPSVSQTTTQWMQATIPRYPVNISTSTTYYLKYYWASVTNSSNEQWFNISALRTR